MQPQDHGCHPDCDSAQKVFAAVAEKLLVEMHVVQHIGWEHHALWSSPECVMQSPVCELHAQQSCHVCAVLVLECPVVQSCHGQVLLCEAQQYEHRTLNHGLHGYLYQLPAIQQV